MNSAVWSMLSLGPKGNKGLISLREYFQSFTTLLKGTLRLHDYQKGTITEGSLFDAATNANLDDQHFYLKSTANMLSFG